MKKLLMLLVLVSVFMFGCGNEEKASSELSPEGVEEILVENIMVETIETNEITFENIEIQSWD